MTEKLKSVLKKSRKHSWKRRKCWLAAFSSFPTMFSEGFSYRAVKIRGSQTLSQTNPGSYVATVEIF